MKKILLICNQGMSTSFLVNKMQKLAGKYALDVSIHAESETKLESIWQENDAILLGPQIGYLLDYAKETVNNQRPVEAISPIDYGRSDVKAVLNQALRMIDEKEI